MEGLIEKSKPLFEDYYSIQGIVIKGKGIGKSLKLLLQIFK